MLSNINSKNQIYYIQVPFAKKKTISKMLDRINLKRAALGKILFSKKTRKLIVETIADTNVVATSTIDASTAVPVAAVVSEAVSTVQPIFNPSTSTCVYNNYTRRDRTIPIIQGVAPFPKPVTGRKRNRGIEGRDKTMGSGGGGGIGEGGRKEQEVPIILLSSSVGRGERGRKVVSNKRLRREVPEKEEEKEEYEDGGKKRKDDPNWGWYQREDEEESGYDSAEEGSGNDEGSGYGTDDNDINLENDNMPLNDPTSVSEFLGGRGGVDHNYLEGSTQPQSQDLVDILRNNDLDREALHLVRNINRVTRAKRYK